MRHLPNIICVLRIALVWPVAAALAHREYLLALALIIVAGVSDVVDGYLAKRFNWTSELGKLLDPLADKLLLVTVFVEAAWLGLAPWWLTSAVVARDDAAAGGKAGGAGGGEQDPAAGGRGAPRAPAAAHAAIARNSITTTLVFGVYAVAVLAALLTLGKLSDHVGRRPVLLAALAVQAASLLVFATASARRASPDCCRLTST